MNSRTKYNISRYAPRYVPPKKITFDIGDKVIINGRLCWVDALTDPAVRLRVFSRRVWVPRWAMDHIKDNEFRINAMLEMDADQFGLFGVAGWVPRLRYMIADCLPSARVRVAYENGAILWGKGLAEFLAAVQYNGRFLWIDYVDCDFIHIEVVS